MKIIIPMSGVGKRFATVGYDRPKALIRVNGKPIIEYVVSMFPGDHQFIFICNEEHLETTDMWSVLKSIQPQADIVSIPKHTMGPAFALTYIFEAIDDDEDIMVSYCDYYMEWDFHDFMNKMEEGKYDGAVPVYTGFHPHLLHKNIYASAIVDDNGLISELREKHRFRDDPAEGFHSPGAYYFRKGSDLKKYTEELLDSDIRINGEAYTSMLYPLYLRDNKKLFAPKVTRFMQWGTPSDLEEFEAWLRFFSKKTGKEKKETDIPTSRESLVKIPHEEGTESFTKSHNYWEEYFTKK